MDSKVSAIDVNNNAYTTPIAVAVVFNLKKNDDDRRVTQYVDDLDNENNIRYFNNKGLAESVIVATNFHEQQPTLKYFCKHVKRTEQIYSLIQALKEKITNQKTISNELLKNVAKGWSLVSKQPPTPIIYNI